MTDSPRSSPRKGRSAGASALGGGAAAGSPLSPPDLPSQTTDDADMDSGDELRVIWDHRTPGGCSDPAELMASLAKSCPSSSSGSAVTPGSRRSARQQDRRKSAVYDLQVSTGKRSRKRGGGSRRAEDLEALKQIISGLDAASGADETLAADSQPSSSGETCTQAEIEAKRIRARILRNKKAALKRRSGRKK